MPGAMSSRKRTVDDVKRELRSAVNRRNDIRLRLASLHTGHAGTCADIGRLLDELCDLKRAELEAYADALVDEDGEPAQALPHARLI